MKKILIGLLTLTSILSFALEDQELSYRCIFQTQSGRQADQVFEGLLELGQTAFATRPNQLGKGLINTYAQGIRLYLMRNPNNLSNVFVVMQSQNDYINAVTITPGSEVITKPALYKSQVSRIIKFGPIETKHELKERGLRRKFSGELTCTFSVKA